MVEDECLQNHMSCRTYWRIFIWCCWQHPPNAFPFWASPFYTFLFCFLCKSASSFVAWAISLKQLATRRRTDPREPLTKIPLIHLRSNSTMQFLTITTVVALAAARPFHNEARTLAVDLVGRSPKAWLQGSPAPKCNDRKVVDSNSHLENQRFLPCQWWRI